MLRDLSFRSFLTPVGGILKRDRAACGPATLHATLQLGLIRQADQEWSSFSKLTILLGYCIYFTSAAIVFFSQNEQLTSTFAYFAEALEDLHKFGVITRMSSSNEQWFARSAIHGATELVIAGVSGLVSPEQAAKVITSIVMKALQ
jgi:hypothetical protein